MQGAIEKTAKMVLTEQSPKQAMLVRSSLYELLAACVPSDILLKVPCACTHAYVYIYIYMCVYTHACGDQVVLQTIQAQEGKNSLKKMVLRRMFLGHQGRRDILDKNFVKMAFFCCSRQGAAEMSRDLGRDVPNLEKLYAGNFGLIFFPYKLCMRAAKKILKIMISLQLALRPSLHQHAILLPLTMHESPLGWLG